MILAFKRPPSKFQRDSQKGEIKAHISSNHRIFGVNIILIKTALYKTRQLGITLNNLK